jgi:hypothetical protein
MKKILAAVFAMMFAVSTGAFAASHAKGEMKKDEKAAPKADAKGGKAEAKKDEKAKK